MAAVSWCGRPEQSSYSAARKAQSTASKMDTYMVRVYPGDLSSLQEYVSVEATKDTKTDDVINKSVYKLHLGHSSQFDLAECFCSGGQLCKERRLELDEYPVRVQLLWPRTVQRNDLHTTEYRFFLRKKEPDKKRGSWLEYGEPSPIDSFLSAFLEQHKNKEYPDLCNLPDLNETTLLENLQFRFENGHIYTYVGSILISLNPFRFYPIYNPKYVKMYQNRKLGELPPHIFAIADSAYHRMLRDKANQCIVISGESGSGKTESTNLLLHHLSALSHKGMLSSGVEQTILGAGPVLEAFGNAKTVHNNNSSRFGKFIQVNYKEDGMVHGAVVEKYLLEKSRIVAQAEWERNYHVFYYLLAGSSEKELQALSLSQPENYHYLNQSKCYTLEGIDGECVDEAHEFARLKQSMEIVGFSGDAQHKIFSLLAAVLQLGNVNFKKKPDHQHHDAVTIQNKDQIKVISEMLKVKEATLVQALTTRKTVAGGETVVMSYNMAGAIATRDAMAKCLYSALFDWIVLQINRALLSKRDFREHQGYSIGVLDIFGFEDFNCNSFEQMCINYANEHLQYYFNQHIFKFEQEEYNREGIQWKNIEFIDNTGCLDLFAKKPTGLLYLLDEESHFPGGTNESLLDKFHRQHQSNQYYQVPQMRENAFTVVHYAGKVKYQIQDMREKNLDLMRQDIMLVLKNSSLAFVRELVGCDPVAMFRWSILRAFFKGYFAFKQAGNGTLPGAEMVRRTRQNPKPLSALGCTLYQVTLAYNVLRRIHNAGATPKHLWKRAKRERLKADNASPSRMSSQHASLHKHESLCPLENFNAADSKAIMRANRVMMKNKSFKPKARYLKGLRDLQSIKTVAGQIATPKLSKAKGKTPSVSAQFNASLSKLMETLSTASPLFIRCIKSNNDKAPCLFDKDCVLRQLRYTGMLATVKIRQSGYNYRLAISEFIQMYKILLPKGLLSSRKDIQRFLQSLDLNQDNYQIGKNKVFLRETEKMLLDDALHQAIMKCIVTIQRWYLTKIQHRHFCRMKLAAVVIQSALRTFIAKRELESLKHRFVSCIMIQRTYRGYRDRKSVKDLHKAATVIQAAYRGYTARKLVKKTQCSLVKVQACARGFLARKRCHELKKAKQLEEDARMNDTDAELHPGTITNQDSVISNQSVINEKPSIERKPSAEKHPLQRSTPVSSTARRKLIVGDVSKNPEILKNEVEPCEDETDGLPKAQEQSLRNHDNKINDTSLSTKIGQSPTKLTQGKLLNPMSQRRQKPSRDGRLDLPTIPVRKNKFDITSKDSAKRRDESLETQNVSLPRSMPELPVVHPDLTRKISEGSIESNSTSRAEHGREKLSRTCSADTVIDAKPPSGSPSSDTSPSKTPRSIRRVSKLRETLPNERIKSDKTDGWRDQSGKSKDDVNIIRDRTRKIREEPEICVEPATPVREMLDLQSSISDEGILTKESSVEELPVDRSYKRSQRHESEESSGIMDDSESETTTLGLPGQRSRSGSQATPPSTPSTPSLHGVADMSGVLSGSFPYRPPEPLRNEALPKISVQPGPRDLEIIIKPAVQKAASADMVLLYEADKAVVQEKRVSAPIAQMESLEDASVVDPSVKMKHIVVPQETIKEAPASDQGFTYTKDEGQGTQYKSPFHKAKKHIKNIMDTSSSSLASLPEIQSLQVEHTGSSRWRFKLRRRSGFTKSKEDRAADDLGGFFERTELRSKSLKLKSSKLSFRQLLDARSARKHAKKDPDDSEEEETTPVTSPTTGNAPTSLSPQTAVDQNASTNKQKHRRKGSKKRRDNKVKGRGEEPKDEQGWNVASTAAEKYPTHTIVKDFSQLQQLQQFISLKISEFQKHSGKRDTVFDVVFKKALKGFHSTLITQLPIQKEGFFEVTYRDCMVNFEESLKAKAAQETSDVSFPVTLGLNAFRGFLDEFEKKRQNKELKETSKQKKERKKQDKENIIHHEGHEFVVTQFSIPTYCELCAGYVWLMEKGLLCQACKYILHRKCLNKSKTYCKGSSRSSSLEKKVIGSHLAGLVNAEQKVPVVVERMMQSLELNGLYTVGLYRKPGPAGKVRELIKDINTDQDKVDFKDCPVHILTSVVKQFFRDLPEPVMTFDLYNDFLNATEVQDQSERAQSLINVIHKLPQENYDLLERLVFHLAKVALHESVNKMSASSLAIIFAPTILRTHRSLPAQESLSHVPKQSCCVQVIIEHQMRKIKQTISDIKTLESAAITAEDRLTEVRLSRRTKAKKAGEEVSLEDIPPEVEEEGESAAEEILLKEQIDSINKEKEALTVGLPTLERCHSSSEDDMLSTEDMDSTGDELDNIEKEEYAVTFEYPASPPKVLGQVTKRRAQAPNRRKPSKRLSGSFDQAYIEQRFTDASSSNPESHPPELQPFPSQLFTSPSDKTEDQDAPVLNPLTPPELKQVGDEIIV